MSTVELFDFSHHADIILRDEVNGNALSAETASTTDAVNVVFSVCGKVVVDDERDLLHVDTTGQEIGSDKYTGRAGAEFLHDDVTLSLLHVAVHGRHGEVTSSEFVGEPVNLSSCVAEDDGLSDGDCFVKIGESVKLPVLLLDGDVELLDTLEGEFGLLDQDADWVAHELCGNFKDILGHSGGQKDNLG